MKKLYRNKLIGTVVFIFILAGFILAGFSYAQAKFISTKGHLNIDGVVASVGASSLTVVTSGSTPITVDVYERRSKFSWGTSLSDLVPGDQVSITARMSGSGNPTARFIRKWGSGPGYGTAGDTVVTTHATFVSKTANTFTVNNGPSLVTFKVLTSTSFMGKSFANLEAGDMVNVVGEDSGTQFVARRVFTKR